ncbi:MAG: hypothetical protein ABEJ79_01545 [Halolamina sp.]
MDLEELRTVRATERQKDSLQHLRDDFYEEVADYLADLRETRDAAAEAADRPYQNGRVRRLSDEIQTAEDVAEALYERRVGKVVKTASFAAADMPVEDEGLTDHERALFDDLVERIERNKTTVLDGLAGDASLDLGDGTAPESEQSPPRPSESTPVTRAADAEPTADDSDAGDATDAADDLLADAMGGDAGPPATEANGRADASDAGSSPDDSTTPEPPRPPEPPEPGVDGGPDVVDDGHAASTPSPAEAPPRDTDRADGGETDAPETDDAARRPVPAGGASAGDPEGGPTDDREDKRDRTTVRVTADVGEILGVDDRSYDLAADDVVRLPDENAEPLLARDAAERLE